MNTRHLSNLRGILSGLFFCTLGFLGSIATLHAQSVDIPDPALNAVIRQALNKFDGDLTVEDMQNLVTLQNWGGLSQIKTLEGLQAATNLEALALNQCLAPEPDLSALASLTHLTTLDLASNQLESLELPAGLNNLTTLDLGRNQLSELILPGGLDRLTTLRLDYNELLENVSILEDLPSLETLSLQKSHLDDFSFLEQLPALTSLDLSYYQQPGLLLPDGLSALTSLNLHGSRLTTFTLPRGLAKLRSLDLSYPPPTGWDAHSIDFESRGPLENLTLSPDMANLTTLSASHQRLITLSVPEELTHLTTLILCHNELTSLQLAGLPNLAELYLWNTPLSDTPGLLAATLAPLASSPELDVLSKSLPCLISHDPSDHTITVRWKGSPGQGNIVQRSPDLIDWSYGYWVEVGEDGIGTYTDGLTPSSPRMGFYRVMIVPDLYHGGDMDGPCPDFIIVW